MLKVVGTRGDSLALIDHTNKIDRKLVDDDKSLYSSINKLSEVIITQGSNQEDARKYGSMFTP